MGTSKTDYETLVVIIEYFRNKVCVELKVGKSRMGFSI